MDDNEILKCFTDEEKMAILRLAAEKELSVMQILIGAIRTYELIANYSIYTRAEWEIGKD